MVEQVVEAGTATNGAARDGALPDLELYLLLEAIVRYSGHDFRDYSQATLKRRVYERMRAEDVSTISALQERVLHHPEALSQFVLAMSSNANALFRDPEYFKVFREQVVPMLRTYSFVRLWFPGCSTGEDVYAVAAILAEQGVLEKCMIYATDVSNEAIARAKTGVFEIASQHELAMDVQSSGGTTSLSNYAEISEREVVFNESLKSNIIFAQHSLATDGSINEFHAIVARGVLSQFNKALQFRVHNLFLQSLSRLGFLCLGANESLKMTPHERAFRQINDAPIYRRMR